LRFTHEGKIDVIYIDPPYNRGENDFIYNDNYIDKEDSFRHSKWLSFMSKRIKLSKNLLSNDGVIFISIDKNEVAQLKLLMDEIFGEKNYIEIFSWVKTETPSNLSNKSKEKVEYILCYQRQQNNLRFRGLMKTSSSDNPMMKHQNSIKDLEFNPGELKIKIKEPKINAGVYGTAKYSIELLNDLLIREGTNANKVTLRAKFIWTQQNLSDELKNGTVLTIKTKTMILSYEKKEYDPEVPPNLIDSSFGVGTNENAESELIALDLNDFDYPKPTSLIEYLLKFNGKNNGIILDFFAGSGTTLDALMQLNSLDGGKRIGIICTNNQNGIAENICFERNKRKILGYTSRLGVKTEPLVANNLRYFKADFVSREPSLKNKRELTQLATELLCIKEDCYTEQKIDIKQARMFANRNVTLIVLFDDHIIPQAVEFIKRIEAPEIKVYVFSMGSDPYTDDFADVLDKITLCALPDAIYKAYQNVLPKKNKIVPTIEEDSETHTNESGEQLSIL